MQRLTHFMGFFSDTDECASNPCRNGGTCFDQVNSFACTCPFPMGGDLCDVGEDHKNWA